MNKKITATLTEDHIFSCHGNIIGWSGENDVTQLEITLDDSLCDYWFYLDFIKPDGTKYKTLKLDVIENKVVYDVPNTLLTEKGVLKAQCVLQDEEGEVWKSTIELFRVNQSINATDDIPNQDDFITEAQKLLDEIKNSGGTGGGAIDDVRVDGVSVVKDRIANINLSSLEKTLQDILTIIQGGELDENQVAQIEQLIVSYFESKTVEEVEK